MRLPVLALVALIVTGCSLVEVEDDNAKPPPTEATVDGAQFTLSSSVEVEERFSPGTPLSVIQAQLAVHNPTQTTFSAFCGACPWELRICRED